MELDGLKWEILDNCKPYAKKIEELYLKCLNKAQNKFEIMNATFFEKLGSNPKNCFFIICKKDDEVIGFSINTEDKKFTHGLYLGYEEEYRKSNIYFGIFYKFIDESIKRGKNIVYLGQTSYEAKSAIGAKLKQCYLGIYSYNKIIMFLVRKMKHILFPETNLPKRNVRLKKL